MIAYLLLASCWTLRESILPWDEWAMILGVSVVPLAPFAAAPLALSWNRHR